MHCLVVVSKHFCSGPSGGHSCTHAWPASGQGWVREHVCGPHTPALRSKQVPLGGGAAQRSEQNSFGCAQGVDGSHGSAVHCMSTVLKQVPETGGRQLPRQFCSAARQVACWPPIIAAQSFMQALFTSPSALMQAVAHALPVVCAAPKQARAVAPQAPAHESDAVIPAGAAGGQVVRQSERAA